MSNGDLQKTSLVRAAIEMDHATQTSDKTTSYVSQEAKIYDMSKVSMSNTRWLSTVADVSCPVDEQG